MIEKLFELLQLAWYANITEFCTYNSEFLFSFDMIFSILYFQNTATSLHLLIVVTPNRIIHLK